jgi:glycine/D-amino acid oxidase-like deaminating enzyme
MCVRARARACVSKDASRGHGEEVGGRGCGGDDGGFHIVVAAGHGSSRIGNMVGDSALLSYPIKGYVLEVPTVPTAPTVPMPTTHVTSVGSGSCSSGADDVGTRDDQSDHIPCPPSYSDMRLLMMSSKYLRRL